MPQWRRLIPAQRKTSLLRRRLDGSLSCLTNSCTDGPEPLLVMVTCNEFGKRNQAALRQHDKRNFSSSLSFSKRNAPTPYIIQRQTGVGYNITALRCTIPEALLLLFSRLQRPLESHKLSISPDQAVLMLVVDSREWRRQSDGREHSVCCLAIPREPVAQRRCSVWLSRPSRPLSNSSFSDVDMSLTSRQAHVTTQTER
jgi:hypothetical protein